MEQHGGTKLPWILGTFHAKQQIFHPDPVVVFSHLCLVTEFIKDALQSFYKVNAGCPKNCFHVLKLSTTWELFFGTPCRKHCLTKSTFGIELDLWCATSVDTYGNMLTWDRCESTCDHTSEDTTPQVVISPGNEEGNCCKYRVSQKNGDKILRSILLPFIYAYYVDRLCSRILSPFFSDALY